MTVWICIKPSVSMLSTILLPVLFMISYIAMEKKYEMTKSNSEYSLVDDDDHEFPTLERAQMRLDGSAEHSTTTLSTRHSLVATLNSMPLAVVAFIGLFCHHLSLQAVATTLGFPASGISPRAHYQYYFFAAVVGEFVGRSHGFVLELIPLQIPLTTRHTWIFTALITLTLLVLLLQTWYFFVQNAIWIVTSQLFVSGASCGALYINTLETAGHGGNERYTEFCRAFLIFKKICGMFMAGFAGIFVEPLLRSNCMETRFINTKPEYCFTRAVDGWEPGNECLT